jgi:histidine phosphotransfer protein HptB
MSQAPIDDAVFEELKETAGAEFVVELVGTFFEEAPAMLADLRAALAAADGAAFRRAAHSIKSNASTFGATALAEQARSLELGGLPGDVAGVDAMDQAYALAAAALKERIGG